MTLLMRDQENIEKGVVYGAIIIYRDLGLSEVEIKEKLHEKFQVSYEEAEQYLLDNRI